METDDDPSVHRLEASAPATGGLVIKKKDPEGTFKVPKTSMLGLDRLAAQKRKERETQQRLISFKDSEFDDEAGSTPKSDTSRTPDLSNVHKLSRHYREVKDDTPSHGGGVSSKAVNRLAELSEKEKRGVHMSSKDHKKQRRDDDYDSKQRGQRERNRDRDRDREYDRRRESDRRHSRDRSERDRDRPSSRSNRRRSDSERSLHTPRFKDEPRTPYAAATSSASWDDDDEKSSGKRSAWDYPTPKDSGRSSEWSTRSSSSSLYRLKKSKMEDDTPRPTPAHKYNEWATDRKKSGATPMPGMFKLIFRQFFFDIFMISYDFRSIR